MSSVDFGALDHSTNGSQNHSLSNGTNFSVWQPIIRPVAALREVMHGRAYVSTALDLSSNFQKALFSQRGYTDEERDSMNESEADGTAKA